MLKVTN